MEKYNNILNQYFYYDNNNMLSYEFIKYYYEVKQEIEKL